MENNTSVLKQLLESDMYLEDVTLWPDYPLVSINQVRRLATSLLVACLDRQLQNDIGRGLIQRILERHAEQLRSIPDFESAVTLEVMVLEGDRLLNSLLPGKKSAILRILVHYAKLPFRDVDSILGLCAFKLFTKLAFDNQASSVPFLLHLSELSEVAPELVTKDYIAIGAFSVLSSLKYAPVA